MRQGRRLARLMAPSRDEFRAPRREPRIPPPRSTDTRGLCWVVSNNGAKCRLLVFCVHYRPQPFGVV